jgi:insulysin
MRSSKICGRIYSELVDDALTEFSYDADIAGLKYGFSSHPLGVTLLLSGYNDKLSILAESILRKAKDLVVHEDRLVVIKDKVSLGLSRRDPPPLMHL